MTENLKLNSVKIAFNLIKTVLPAGFFLAVAVAECRAEAPEDLRGLA